MSKRDTWALVGMRLPAFRKLVRAKLQPVANAPWQMQQRNPKTRKLTPRVAYCNLYSRDDMKKLLRDRVIEALK